VGAKRKLFIGPSVVLVVMVLAGVAWLSQIGSSLLEPSGVGGFSKDAQSRGTMYIASTASRQRSSGGGISPNSRFHASVLHSDGQCHVSQHVRNLGRETLESVSLEFTLLSAVGTPVGEKIEAAAVSAIPAGAVRKVDFSFACPASTASIDVGIPEPFESSGASPEVELVSRTTTVEGLGLRTRTSVLLAVEIPSVGICPFPETCKLPVRIDGGGVAPFRFRRPAEDSDMLISDNEILIGHLGGGGTAALNLDEAMSGATVPLTANNLVEVKQPSLFDRWFGRFFEDGRDD